VQGGLISGIDVGPVLVDITPHTLGIQCVGELHSVMSHNLFSPIIARNTPLPASRSEIYYTGVDGQEVAEIHVLQGEDPDVRQNTSVGKFTLEGLDPDAARGNEVLVRFELNLDGILTVTAVERATSLEKKITIDNPVTQFQAKDREEAKSKLASLFAGEFEAPAAVGGAEPISAELQQAIDEARRMISKSQRLAQEAPEQDAHEITELVEQLEDAIAERSPEAIQEIRSKLEDVVFYLEDA
jgi:molecular chaperone DnaK